MVHGADGVKDLLKINQEIKSGAKENEFEKKFQFCRHPHRKADPSPSQSVAFIIAF